MAVIKLTVPDQLAKRIDVERGPLRTRQDWVIAAILDRLEGSAAEKELRAEVARLHETILQLRTAGGGGGVQSTPPPPDPPPTPTERKRLTFSRG